MPSARTGMSVEVMMSSSAYSSCCFDLSVVMVSVSG